MRWFMLIIAMVQFLMAQDSLFLGIKNRYADKREMESSFAPVITALNNVSTQKWALKVYESSEEILEALVRGEIQVAKVSPLSYASKRRSFGLKAIAISLNKEGKAYYFSSIVVYKKSPIKTIADLKGVRFAFGSKFSASSFLVPALLLQTNGISLEDIEYDFKIKQPLILLSLMNGKSEAGAVITDLLSRTRPGTFREIIKSDPIPSSPFIVLASKARILKRPLLETFKKFNLFLAENPQFADQLDADFKYGFSYEVDDTLFDALEKSFREMIPKVR